jgi:hypothetical protein
MRKLKVHVYQKLISANETSWFSYKEGKDGGSACRVDRLVSEMKYGIWHFAKMNKIKLSKKISLYIAKTNASCIQYYI